MMSGVVDSSSMQVVRFITICTTSFLPLAQRLAVSLERSGNHYPLTVYCDAEKAFAALQRAANCELRELPEIQRFGVKRAKFLAYTRALTEFGDFLYLDADIIVLGELGSLRGSALLRAAPDDLSACPFITDRHHPWPGDPELSNDCYVNSGVLYVPAGLSDFFEYMRERSLSNECWQRYIIPGRLYDNHFLCAHLNLCNVPVDPIDPEQYNWPGFLLRGELQVTRQGHQLVNKTSGKPLKLVHFAGISDVEALLCSLPVDVASLLCELSTPDTGKLESEFANFQASLSGSLNQPPRDEFVKTVFDRLRFELLTLAKGGWSTDYQQRNSYFVDPDSILSLVYSRPNSQALWNGLQCGGAYLEGDEYNYLAGLVNSGRIRTAVETGAGETSICLRRKGVECVALEAIQGPWLKRAQAAGCRGIHVPFLGEQSEFEPAALAAALRDVPRQIDLVFIYSPVGTKNRSRVLTQLLRTLRPRLVLFHDAHRDAQNLYRYQTEHDLRVIDYLPSRRGMVLFALGQQTCGPPPRLQDNAIIRTAQWCISVKEPPKEVTTGTRFALTIMVENRGDQILSSRYSNPIHVSYHWLDEQDTAVVYDGLRTALPFDVHPGDSATFSIELQAPEAPGTLYAQVALVQELVSWFDQGENDSWRKLRVSVETPGKRDGK
jgi:hypothetical protein